MDPPFFDCSTSHHLRLFPCLYQTNKIYKKIVRTKTCWGQNLDLNHSLKSPRYAITYQTFFVCLCTIVKQRCNKFSNLSLVQMRALELITRVLTIQPNCLGTTMSTCQLCELYLISCPLLRAFIK